MSNKKSLSVAQALLSRCKGGGDDAVTPMQLIKLTYIAHGYMLGLHGKPLLDESVEAWRYGPVVPSVYHAVKQFRSDPVTNVAGAQNDFAFSDEETAVIDSVCKIYGKYNGIVLSSATHKSGTPWHQTWEAFGRNSPISNDLIEAFYAALLKQPRHSTL